MSPRTILSTVVTAAATTLAAALPGDLAAQLPDGTIYFTEGYGGTALSTGSVSFSGADVFALLDLETPRTLGIGLDRERCQIYVPISQGFGTAIDRFDTNGTDRQTVIAFGSGQPTPIGVVVEPLGERLYWIANSGTTRIGSCRLDGSDPQLLVAYNAVTPQVQPWVIQIDRANDKIYWFDAAYGGFRRCNLDGSQIEHLLQTGPAWSADIDVVHGDFYWTHFDELRRAPIDGSSAPLVIVNDPGVFTPSTGKYLDVEPALDLITWTVSGGRIHWTSLSSPGTVAATPNATGYVPNGGLEVMPGPRVGLSIEPAVISPGGSTSFDVCGVIPNGPFALFVASVNGTPFSAFLLGAFTDAEGRFHLPATFDPAVTGIGFTFDVVAVDPTSRIVWTLPAPLTFL